MTEERTPRDIEQRDSVTRPSDSWTPASVIPNPAPKMAGYFVGSGQVLWVKVMELIHPECLGKVGSL